MSFKGQTIETTRSRPSWSVGNYAFRALLQSAPKKKRRIQDLLPLRDIAFGMTTSSSILPV